MGTQERRTNTPSVGDTVTVRPTAMANGGNAIARLDDLVVFVDGVIPGETAQAQITERRKNFVRARVTTIEEPSPSRVLPPCHYFGRCGGCQWQHMAYAAQLEAKQAILIDQFLRGRVLPGDALASLFREPIGMIEPWNYRNVITVEPDGVGKPSFHHLHSAELVAIDHCPISERAVSDTLGKLSADGIAAETTVRANVDGAVVATTARQRATVRQSVLTVTFRVTSGAFFQVNTRPEVRPGHAKPRSMADLLAIEVLRGLALTGAQSILDLYAGVGTFAILIARHARRVIAVEEVAVAATDARFNAANAGVTNVEIHTRAAEQLLASLDDHYDGIVIDPPRAGCSGPVLEGLLRLKPRRIVYVSCDPATLIRDLRTLCGQYQIESCQLIDMFPQTFHIESVTVLTRMENPR